MGGFSQKLSILTIMVLGFLLGSYASRQYAPSTPSSLDIQKRARTASLNRDKVTSPRLFAKKSESVSDVLDSQKSTLDDVSLADEVNRINSGQYDARTIAIQGTEAH